VDDRLHAERLGPRRRVALSELPDGAFVLLEDAPWLVLGGELLRWTPGGYTDRRGRPSSTAEAITPATTLAVLRAGWSGVVPFVHPSA
jgi:hypothetical protein